MKKKLFTLALASVAALGLASCGGNTNPTTTTTTAPAQTTTTTAPATTTPAPATTTPAQSKEVKLTLDEYKGYVKAELGFDFSSIEADKQNLGDAYVSAKAIYDAALLAIDAQTSISNVKEVYDTALSAIIEAIPVANGIYDYTGLSLDERREIIAAVEKYAVATGLTGLTLYESGGYQLVNPRVTLGTENYIISYGFGILAEGKINAPLDAESNEAWKNYYHSYETSDPATANYWNDKGAQVGDLYGYFNASLFTTFLNDTKDSYKWVGELSKDDRPIAVNPAADGTSKTWRVRIKTKEDGLKYSTLSQNPERAAYNNLGVEAEDYLTPYKVQLTQSNKLFRGGEYKAATGVKIAGLSEYYDATANCEGLFDQDAWNKNVGDNLKVYQEGDDWYFQWTNTQATNAFYAMYYIASSMYSPLPSSFIELVTVANLFGYNSDKTLSPVDNSLSLGAYMLESWESDKAVVYKKNPNYTFANSKYSIEGVHLAILTGISTDEDLAVKEFLAGKLDAAGITQNYLDEYKTDPRAHFWGSGSNFKLNLNTASEEVWEYYFGENGIVSKTAKEDYWDVEPALSNLHFVRGLSYALNRKSVADAHASVPSFSYLGGNYMSDPENGEFYNSTEDHKNAIQFFIDDTDGYGYSLTLARDYFKMAIAELEAEGVYQRGTPENPTVITLEIAWMYPYQEDTYHAEVKQMLEEAFNDESVFGGCYELNVEFWAGQEWSDVYYNKLMLGNFDLGFGSISGNTYDILDYLTVLSADQTLSGGFTLNWGPQTDNPDQYVLVYDGVKWSFDALLAAANGATVVKDGKIAPAYTVDSDEFYKANQDGSVEVSIKVSAGAGLDVELLDLVGFGELGGQSGSEFYDEASVLAFNDEDVALNVVKNVLEDGSVEFKVTVSAEDVAKWSVEYFRAGHEGQIGFDLYLSVAGNVDGVDYVFANGYVSSFYVGPETQQAA